MLESVEAKSDKGQENEAGFKVVSELCEKAVQDGVFPGAVILAARGGNVVYHRSFGFKSMRSAKTTEPAPMELDTVFDLASLTALVVTATLMMKLYESGKIKLSDRVSRYIQAFAVLGKSSITIEQLLSHSSGLPAWVPFFEELLEAQAGERRGIITSRGAKDYILNAINRMELKYAPGSKQVYSDIGLILLGVLIEVLTGLSLEKAAQRLIFQPLGLKSTSYIDLSMIKRRGIHPVRDLIAPTEECPWRKRVLCGEVHDDNAWVMGGIAGHSGLFSNAGDLHIFCAEMLRAWRGDSSLLKQETLRVFWTPGFKFEEGYLCGWDRPSKENGMIESGLSPQAVGQNGFTGCSLWLEPQEGLEIILLSNRVHPTRNNKKIFSFRPEIHHAILDALRRQ